MLTCQGGTGYYKAVTTSPVVSWRGWETPPLPSTTAQLSFFAQPRLGEDLSLHDGLPSSSATGLCLRLMVGWFLFDLLKYPSSFFFSYVKSIKDLSWGGGPKVWRFPVIV